jgi:hypothetical protein
MACDASIDGEAPAGIDSGEVHGVFDFTQILDEDPEWLDLVVSPISTSGLLSAAGVQKEYNIVGHSSPPGGN